MGTQTLLWPRGSAVFSPCQLYRYRLTRRLHEAGPEFGTIAFCMLNPSTADAEKDDNTIRRTIDYARRWGYGELVIVNVYAYRSTSPRDMERHAAAGVDIVGPDNDAAIRAAAAEATVVVAGWGKHAKLERVERVRMLIPPEKLTALATNDDGSPKHPLYLAKALRPHPWPWKGSSA